MRFSQALLSGLCLILALPASAEELTLAQKIAQVENEGVFGQTSFVYSKPAFGSYPSQAKDHRIFLIEDYKGFKIIKAGNTYYAVNQNQWPIDQNTFKTSTVKSSWVAENKLLLVKEKIDILTNPARLSANASKESRFSQKLYWGSSDFQD